MYHDLSYLPYPFLARQILAAAEYQPALAKQAIRSALRSVGQKRSAISVLNQLHANELRALAKAGNFAAIANLRGLWLPGNENDSTLLSAFAANARFMQAGLGATTPAISLQHFNAASQALQAIANQLLTSQEPIARFLPPVLQTWLAALETARTAATA